MNEKQFTGAAGIIRTFPFRTWNRTQNCLLINGVVVHRGTKKRNLPTAKLSTTTAATIVLGSYVAFMRHIAEPSHI